MTIDHISIRELRTDDSQVIADAFTAQGWNKPVSQYEKYWREQSEGNRTVLVAEFEGAFAGYLTVVWESNYPRFVFDEDCRGKLTRQDSRGAPINGTSPAYREAHRE